MGDDQICAAERSTRRPPWNKGKLIGAKLPLRPSPCLVDQDQTADGGLKRDLALLNLAIDSKWRGCDVVAGGVDDMASNRYALNRATAQGFNLGARRARVEVR
jgi:hypothetical protein